MVRKEDVLAFGTSGSGVLAACVGALLKSKNGDWVADSVKANAFGGAK